MAKRKPARAASARRGAGTSKTSRTAAAGSAAKRSATASSRRKTAGAATAAKKVGATNASAKGAKESATRKVATRTGSARTAPAKGTSAVARPAAGASSKTTRPGSSSSRSTAPGTKTTASTTRPSAASGKSSASRGRTARGGQVAVPQKTISTRTPRRARDTEPDETMIPSPPSSLDLDRTASAARSGRLEMEERRARHTSSSPALTAGDVDADWQSADSIGDEAPGGDNPTPDQDVVDEIGQALGVQYDDDEELKGGEEIAERDRHRWELDPASSDDFDEREE